MPNVWFTADTHFGHCNILQYCARPFKDHEHMNEAMIERFNEVLRPGDVLWHLGDVKHSQVSFDETYGHSHGNLPGIGRQMDVGVDTNDFRPYALEDIVQRMERIPVAAGDVE